MSIIKKLGNVQSKLKAPKGQTNTFGNYKYRNCEDILEAVKSLLTEEGLVIYISDTIEMVGNRFYVKATVTISDGESDLSNTAYARESEDKKGMDASQITGAASSYARKYALNGLLLIDDTKDADSLDNTVDTKAEPEKAWYNDFDKHKAVMLERINAGESADVIVSNLKEKFKLSKEIETKIKSLGKE